MFMTVTNLNTVVRSSQRRVAVERFAERVVIRVASTTRDMRAKASPVEDTKLGIIVKTRRHMLELIRRSPYGAHVDLREMENALERAASLDEDMKRSRFMASVLSTTDEEREIANASIALSIQIDVLTAPSVRDIPTVSCSADAGTNESNSESNSESATA